MTKPAVLGGPRTKTTPFPCWPDWDQRDESRVLEALRSGVWSRGFGGAARSDAASSSVTLLERAVAQLHDARFALGVTSGTAALDIAVRATGVGPGDEVIVPAYSFVASATCVIWSGARPVFVDVDPGTLNIDSAQAERAVTGRTRAIVVVHFGGQPADMDALVELAHRHSLVIIEDAAQAIGATWKGRPVGAIGAAGCISFESGKNVSCGEGGMLLTSDEALYERSCSLHSAGRDPGGPRYRHVRLGWNYRLPELQGALALSQLARLEEQHMRRAASAVGLRRLLAGFEGIGLVDQDPRVTRDAHHLFVMRFHAERWGGLTRRRFVMALNAEGIPCNEGYPDTIPRLGLFKNPGMSEVSGDLPVAERAAREVFWLPQHLLLGQDQDMQEIAGAVAKIWEHRTEIARGRN